MPGPLDSEQDHFGSLFSRSEDAANDLRPIVDFGRERRDNRLAGTFVRADPIVDRMPDRIEMNLRDASFAFPAVEGANLSSCRENASPKQGGTVCRFPFPSVRRRGRSPRFGPRVRRPVDTTSARRSTCPWHRPGDCRHLPPSPGRRAPPVRTRRRRCFASAHNRSNCRHSRCGAPSVRPVPLG